jgi:hypothetical protein
MPRCWITVRRSTACQDGPCASPKRHFHALGVCPQKVTSCPEMRPRSRLARHTPRSGLCPEIPETGLRRAVCPRIEKCCLRMNRAQPPMSPRHERYSSLKGSVRAARWGGGAPAQTGHDHRTRTSRSPGNSRVPAGASDRPGPAGRSRTTPAPRGRGRSESAAWSYSSPRVYPSNRSIVSPRVASTFR